MLNLYLNTILSVDLNDRPKDTNTHGPSYISF